MKENFLIDITSLHVADNGNSPNVFELTQEQLAKREVIKIDIANDPVLPSDYVLEEDPQKFLSVKTGRGNLGKDWINTTQPVMTCYKLVTVEFKWFGLQRRIEAFIQSVSLKF